MVLLTGFFRKLSTKIYIIIFSVLLTGIIILFCFSDYYSRLLNSIFQENTCLLMVSKDDYYEEINKYKSVKKIERALLFKPDYNYDVLGREGYQIWKDGDMVDQRLGEAQLRINWEDYITPYLNYILIFSDPNLKDNQISMGFTPVINYEIPIEEIIGEPIGFKIGDSKQEFIIDNLYKSHFPEMRISQKMFDKLSTIDNSFYGYKVTINDYKSAEKIMNNFKKIDNDLNLKVTLNTIDRSEDNGNKNEKESLKGIVQVLEIVSFVVIISFTIILIVVMKNIVSDEKHDININRLLGFNKKQIKKFLLIKILVFNIFIFINSIILSFFIINIVNKNSNLNMTPLNYKLFYTYGIVLVMSLVSCIFYGSKTSKYIRIFD